VASGASLVNLRVLNSQGIGKVSGVLSALDWIVTNRGLHNIKVVNMSLGTPAISSYKNDPICRAVRKLADAGVVVVAAAGNDGMLGEQKVYGAIHTPGSEPSAITVGASNSFGTDARQEDSVTTYSSRGPTRSFTEDSAGIRHYDNLIKPDLVAPGNRIVAAQARDNYLIRQNPALATNLYSSSSMKLMTLSGTSMATPMVAGAVAMLFEVNPNLTPNLIKMLLMYSAQPLSGFNTLEQGTGQLNIAGGVALARLIKTDLLGATQSTLGANMLTQSAPGPQTNISSFTFTWAQGAVLNRATVTGPELITNYQRSYGKGYLLGDGIMEAPTYQSLNFSMWTRNLLRPSKV
jgi:subtilisin family serine protease